MDYTYVVYSSDNRVVKGRLAAGSAQTAEDSLVRSGYRVLSLKPAGTFSLNMTLFQAKVKPTELMMFSKQLALLVESGVSLIQALELLQNQTSDKQLKKVLIEIVTDIRGGSALSEAMARHPNVFSNLYYRMVGVGEQTGSLEGVLRNMADFIERQTAIANKIKAAMTYPTIVVSLGIVILIMVVTFVLPPLVNLVTGLGGELPITTKILMAVTDFASQYILHTVAALLGLVFIMFMLVRTNTGRYYWDWLMLKLPLIGRASLLSELARDSRNIAVLYKAGLPLPEIIALTAQASGNRVVARALGNIEYDMLRGEGLAGPLSKRPVFLPMMVEMARVGEETGNLDATLATVADTFEVEADRRIQAMLTMLEPAMTIAMGIGVGFVALSLFMPLYGSLNVIGGG